MLYYQEFCTNKGKFNLVARQPYLYLLATDSLKMYISFISQYHVHVLSYRSRFYPQ